MVGFYFLLNKESSFSVKSIGIHFTSYLIDCDSILSISKPSIEYRSADFNDTQNWMLATTAYKAKGTEKYLYLGNFNIDTSHIDIPDSLNYNIKQYGYSLVPGKTFNQGAFYFIDDVFVIPLKEYATDISKVKFEKGKSVNLNNLFFETDKAELLSASFIELDKLVSIIKADASLIIVIRGHTDNAGTEEHNQQLSVDRSNAVMNYLVKNGIAANRMSTWGFGSSRPLASNVTEEGKALNRRVEIQVK